MNTKISGKEFMFTGRLSITRAHAQSLIEEAGGISGNSVCSTTDYLIVGEDYGSKLSHALSLGTKTLSEKEFFDLFKEYELPIEKPLSDGEQEQINSRTKKVICIGCGKTFTAWENSNRNTCGVCATKYNPPNCPYCNYKLTIYYTEYGKYHCPICWSWFTAPYSDYARKTNKHLCMLFEAGRTDGGVYRGCPYCQKTFYCTLEEFEREQEYRRRAPEMIVVWEVEDELIRLQLEELKRTEIKEREEFLKSIPENVELQIRQKYQILQNRRIHQK